MAHRLPDPASLSSALIAAVSRAHGSPHASALAPPLAPSLSETEHHPDECALAAPHPSAHAATSSFS